MSNVAHPPLILNVIVLLVPDNTDLIIIHQSLDQRLCKTRQEGSIC